MSSNGDLFWGSRSTSELLDAHGMRFGQRRATELQQELFSSSDVSSGNVVPPLVYTGYSLSQRAKATEAKEHRKQARTNVPLLAGQLLAVARVHSL